MFLRTLLYLSDATLHATTVDVRASRIKPLWVLPRAWCVTASIHAKGVPQHKTEALVRLHLNRLTSFVDSGVYACRAGEWVYLWFWENQRVRDFCQAHDLDFTSLLLAPESVCFPKCREGAVVYRCVEGIEAQLWHKGLLQDSAWWPEMVDAATWQKWRATSAASSVGSTLSAAWPETVPSPRAGQPGLSAPWASNLLGEKWWHHLNVFRTSFVYIAVAGFLLGLVGFWGAQWMTLQKMQGDTDKQIASLSARVDPVSAARDKSLQYLMWTNQIVRLTRQIDVMDVLRNLQPVLQLQDAALRDFEYTDGELRLVLVPVNSELNIATLTQKLEALPIFVNIRLLPDSDVRILHVSAKFREERKNEVDTPGSQTAQRTGNGKENGTNR